MENEKLVHDLIVGHMQRKLARDYQEVKVDQMGDPDLILSNHGLTLAVVEVETEKSITPEKADRWAQMAETGVKLILMVPANSKMKATDLLWQKGIMGSVSVGSYEIKIQIP